MREISETLRTTFRRAFHLPNRRIAVRPGRLERISGFRSAILGNERDLVVYLPAGYDQRADEHHYPVLYMHDGQNLFEADRAFIPGNHWRLREAADDVIGQRGAAPMIIVGIDNAGAARIDEYTPTRDPVRNAGGRAADHARMIIEEIKPMIDSRYRTARGPAHTAIGGSSLGGLSSLYLVLQRPDVFGLAAVMSPSAWWDGRTILKTVEAFTGNARPRIWLDIGLREEGEAVRDARALRDLMRTRGWTAPDFNYLEDRRGEHSERAWAGRARAMLEFLFGTSEL